jgi:signal peptidase I
LAGRIAFWVLFGLAVVALIACFAVPILTIKPFQDPASGMEDAISPGNSILVSAGDLRRGDIIVLHVPARRSGGDPTLGFVKRLIGLPGDHVACCNASGRVTVNGKALNETYLYPHDRPSAKTFSVTLHPGQIWVMGDHRSISVDSRTWGPVPESGVVGRVVTILHGSRVSAPRTPQTYVANGLAPVDKRYEFYVVLALVAVVSAALIVILTIFGTTRFVIRRRRMRRMAEPPRLPYSLRPVPPSPPVAPPAPAATPVKEPVPAPTDPAAQPVTPAAETATLAPDPPQETVTSAEELTETPTDVVASEDVVASKSASDPGRSEERGREERATE